MIESHLLEIKELAKKAKENNLTEEEIEEELKTISSNSGIAFEIIYKMFEENLKAYRY